MTLYGSCFLKETWKLSTKMGWSHELEGSACRAGSLDPLALPAAGLKEAMVARASSLLRWLSAVFERRRTF